MGKIGAFVRIVAKIEELQCVAIEQFLERAWHVVFTCREISGELVLATDHRPHEPSLREIAWSGGRWATVHMARERLSHPRAVDSADTAIGKERGGTWPK